MIEALGSPALVRRSSGFDQPVGVHLLQFLRVCAERGQRGIHGEPHPKAPTVEQAVASGLPIYELYVGDSVLVIRDAAAWLAHLAVAHSAA